MLLGSAAPVMPRKQRDRRRGRLRNGRPCLRSRERPRVSLLTMTLPVATTVCSVGIGPDVHSRSLRVYFSHRPFVARKPPCSACLK